MGPRLIETCANHSTFGVGCGENLAAEKCVAFAGRERLKQRLFHSGALRLAALQFRAPRINAVGVRLDDDTSFAGHLLQVWLSAVRWRV
jgi:hypothetical protein